MATIVDFQIEALAFGSALIEPFNPSQLNPASYDVRLGEGIYIEMTDGAWKKIKAPHFLEPGEFALAEIRETLALPADIEANFQLKSSRAREGYQHMLSGYCDPGYKGILTLELTNANKYRSLPLASDMLIGQIRFSRTDAPSRSPYWDKGHYQGDTGVTPSRVTIYGESIS